MQCPASAVPLSSNLLLHVTALHLSICALFNDAVSSVVSTVQITVVANLYCPGSCVAKKITKRLPGLPLTRIRT